MACQVKFSRSFGGIESYIRHILCFSGISSASSIAKKLSGYSFTFRELLLKNDPQITKSDILWLSAFCRKINCKKDPLSKYLSCR